MKDLLVTAALRLLWKKVSSAHWFSQS